MIEPTLSPALAAGNVSSLSPRLPPVLTAFVSQLAGTQCEFEKDYAGVEDAVRQAGITYPVVPDNEDATWDACDQRFWPTMYFIDSDGFVRYEPFGEGAYEETEATIRELLAERDRNLG